MRNLWGVPLLAVLTACASVEQQTTVSTPVGTSTTVGIGDVVLRAEGRESMPNAFGNADVFGRTRPTGFSTVLYGGLEGHKVKLFRNTVVTQSDATSMNSTGQVIRNGKTTVYIPPAGSTQTSANQGTIPILIDYHANPAVPMMEKVIVIEAATPTSLTYHIE